MKSQLIASGEITPRKMWHLFSSLSSACISPGRLNDNRSISQLSGCDVWGEEGGVLWNVSARLPPVHVHARLCMSTWYMCAWLSWAGISTDVATVAAVSFRPAEHALLTAKLLPPCHYGDTAVAIHQPIGAEEMLKSYGAQGVSLSLYACLLIDRVSIHFCLLI